MDNLKLRLQRREQQIFDMKSQISDLSAESSNLDNEIYDLQGIVASLEEELQQKDLELEKELKIKEDKLLHLQALELEFEKAQEIKSEPKKDAKNQDVTNAYIEFYTKAAQNQPISKNLPEFNKESETISPQMLDDLELDEELEKLGLSDIMKKIIKE